MFFLYDMLGLISIASIHSPRTATAGMVSPGIRRGLAILPTDAPPGHWKAAKGVPGKYEDLVLGKQSHASSSPSSSYAGLGTDDSSIMMGGQAGGPASGIEHPMRSNDSHMGIAKEVSSLRTRSLVRDGIIIHSPIRTPRNKTPRGANHRAGSQQQGGGVPDEDTGEQHHTHRSKASVSFKEVGSSSSREMLSNWSPGRGNRPMPMPSNARRRQQKQRQERQVQHIHDLEYIIGEQQRDIETLKQASLERATEERETTVEHDSKDRNEGTEETMLNGGGDRT
jgi:hypothetical protein